MEFRKAVLGARDKKVNLLVVCVPGMGVTRAAKGVAERSGGRIKYVETAGEELGEFTILDLNFDANEGAMGVAQEYFRKAGVDQKMALIVNDPSGVETEEFAVLGKRLHETYYFELMDEKAVEEMAGRMGVKLAGEKIAKIMKLSGGLARVVKFLVANGGEVDEDLQRGLLPTVRVMAKCSDEVLERLGLWEKGGFRGSILADYFKIHPRQKVLKVKVNSDLSWVEDGVGGRGRLTRVEAHVLKALAEGGVVTKEQIAEVKWGKDSYDEFSDQAIGKTMQRLGGKLTKYKLEVIPKVGYKLI